MPKYSTEAMVRGIEQCENNIRIFEDAIKKEMQTIAEYKWRIEQAQRKEGEREKAKILPEYAQKRCAVDPVEEKVVDAD